MRINFRHISFVTFLFIAIFLFVTNSFIIDSSPKLTLNCMVRGHPAKNFPSECNLFLWYLPQ